jgi:hypothetical protein
MQSEGVGKDRRQPERVEQVATAVIGVALAYNGVVVAVAPGRIGPTYGVLASGPDLEVLLQHRAVMLALIGSLLVASAFRGELRTAAAIVAGASMASFAVIALSAEVNAEQRRVALFDVALFVALIAVVTVPRLKSRLRKGEFR